MEELAYSIGLVGNNDVFFRAITTILLMSGDVIIDGVQHNAATRRIETIKNLDRLGVHHRAFAYVIKRPLEKCQDEFHTEDEIDFSHQIEYPALTEGFEKIMSVTWENSTETLMYGDESLMIKPIINVIHAIPSNGAVIVKPKKGMIKSKLERGRQNLFRLKKDKR